MSWSHALMLFIFAPLSVIGLCLYLDEWRQNRKRKRLDRLNSPFFRGIHSPHYRVYK